MTTERMADRASAIPRGRGVEGTWRTARRDVDLSSPVLMGILNITPDSFSDGGRHFKSADALRRLEELEAEGADVIDIGGESTRPGSLPVGEEEELRRVLPVIEEGVRLNDLPLSIDTTKAAVARAALDAGAEIINDISGLRFDAKMARLAAETGAGVVLMHIRGRPRTMQLDIRYDDLLGEITAELDESVRLALAAGCGGAQLVVDPGIGFGKTAEQNLILINELHRIGELGYPVLVGPSRKSFIGKMMGLDVDERLEPTIAACVVALLRGARLFRVHDVKPVRRALDMAEAIVRQVGSGNPV